MTAILEQAQQWSVPLAVAWAAWMTFGLLLSFWYKRRKDVVVATAPVAVWDTPAPRARPKSGSNIKPAIPIRPQQPKGDAFGELQALLESPVTGNAVSAGRRPGD